MADLDRNMQHIEEKILFPMSVFYFTNRQLQIYVRNAWSKTSTLRGGGDKSLARPTSRSRRTESIVSLEREVCSRAEFLVTEAERKQIRRRARFQQHRDASYQVFFLQGKAPKEIHAILTETLGEHAPSNATVKN